MKSLSRRRWRRWGRCRSWRSWKACKSSEASQSDQSGTACKPNRAQERRIGLKRRRRKEEVFGYGESSLSPCGPLLGERVIWFSFVLVWLFVCIFRCRFFHKLLHTVCVYHDVEPSGLLFISGVIVVSLLFVCWLFCSLFPSVFFTYMILSTSCLRFIPVLIPIPIISLLYFLSWLFSFLLFFCCLVTVTFFP